MILVILTAVLAVCGAGKLNRSYLPPINAKTAGGSPGALLAPVEGLPSGSYTNDDQGVVVDAAAPGTRAAGTEPTGLGGPRTSYGSTDSKVGDAAFSGSLTGIPGGPNTRIAPGFGSIVGIKENTGGPNIRIAPGFEDIVTSQGSDSDKTRASTLKFSQEIGSDNYSYGFETDNGIAIGENGVAADGMKAQGGYSYKGDDGKVYSVSYTADKGGYKPTGSHLPTPPPIPEEILKSLEQNAKEEAAGHVDDGSYDAHKYKDEGDYPSNNSNDNNNRPAVSGGGGATGSGSFGNQAINPNLLGSVHSGFGNSGFGSQNPYIQSTGSHLNLDSKTQGVGILGHSSSTGVQSTQPGFFVPGQLGVNRLQAHTQNGLQAAGLQAPNQVHGFHSHSTLNRFGVQADKFDNSNISGPTSQGLSSSSGLPTLPNFPGFRLPGASNGNSAYSSAVTTGSGSATAFASAGSASPDFKNQYGFAGQASQGLNLKPNSFSGASFPNFAAVNPNDPSSATASASAQGQSASAEAVSSGHQFIGGLNSNSNPTSTHSTHGYNVYSQNKTTIGLGSQPLNPYGSKIPSSTVAAANNFAGAQQTGFSSQPSFSLKPDQYTQLSNASTHNYGTQPTGIPSVVTPTKLPSTELTTPFGLNESPAQFPSPTSSQSSSLQFSQQGYNKNKPQTIQGSFVETGSNSFLSNSPKPSISQPQGSDSSYYYNPPSIPFVTPISVFQADKIPSRQIIGSSTGSSALLSNTHQTNVPITTTFQQGIKHSNTLITGSISPTASTQSGQYQETTTPSYYNGITQASITPFPLAAPTFSTQFESQSSQFGSKPSTQIENLFSSQTKFGAPEQAFQQFGQKPIVQSPVLQFGQQLPSRTENISKSQGTIYEYNKPTSYKENTSTSEHEASSETKPQAKPGQTSFESEGIQFNKHAKPFGSSSQSSTYSPQTIVENQSTQFGQQLSGQNESLKNPVKQGTIYEYNKPTSHKETISTSEHVTFNLTDSQIKPDQTPFATHGTHFSSHQRKPFSSSFHSPSFQHFQPQRFGSQPTSQFGQKAQVGQNISSTSYFQNRSGPSQLPQKPFGSLHTGSTLQETQFGSSTASQFGKAPTTQFGFSGSQFGQRPLTSQTDKPLPVSQQNKGTLYEYNKPTINIPVEKETAPTSSGSQFSQAPKQTQTVQSSTFGSHYTNKFGQKPQTSQITGFQQPQFSSPPQSFPGSPQGPQFEIKPSIETDYFTQKYQFGAFPSHFAQKPYQPNPSFFTQSGTSQFVQKPFDTTQFGSKHQHTQFGSTFGSKNGHKPQSTHGTTFSTNTTPDSHTNNNFGHNHYGHNHYGHKHYGHNHYSHNHYGHNPFSTSSGTGSSPQPGNYFQHKFGTNTGSQNPWTSTTTPKSPSIPTSQFGQKPCGTLQTGSSFTQTGVQFNEKPQIPSVSPLTASTPSKSQTIQPDTSVKPFISTQNTSSSVSQTQFGSITGFPFNQKPQTIDTVSQTSTPYEQKPTEISQTDSSSEQPQLSSTLGSRFGQKPQNTSLTSSIIPEDFAPVVPQTGENPLSSTQTTSSNISQEQVDSTTAPELSQKPQFELEDIFDITPQLQPTSQSDKKPFSSQPTQETFEQNRFDASTGPQFSLNRDSQDDSVPTTQSSQQSFDSLQVTGTDFSLTQVSNTTGSQSDQKLEEGTVSGIPQFDKTPFGLPASLGTGSQFNQNTGSQGQVVQTSELSQQAMGSLQATDSGSLLTQSILNTDSNDTSGQTSQSSEQPVDLSKITGTDFSQTQVSNTTESQSDQKLEEGIVSGIPQFDKTPFGLQASLGTDSQFNQNTGSQGQVQTSELSQQAIGSLQATNSGSLLTQSILNTDFNDASSQTAQSSQQPVDLSQVTGTDSSQTQVESTNNGSQIDQKLEVGPGSGFLPFDERLSGLQTSLGTFQSTQFNTSADPQFGQNTAELGQQLIGSSQATGSGSLQTQPISSVPKGQSAPIIQVSQKPLSVSRSSSRPQLFGSTGSQFATTPQSEVDTFFSNVNPQVVPIFLYGKRPLIDLPSTQNSDSQTLFDSFTENRFGDDIEGQEGIEQIQKPIGSSQADSSFHKSEPNLSFDSQHIQEPALDTKALNSIFPTPQSQKPIFTASRFGDQSQQEDQKLQPDQVSFEAQDSSLKFNGEPSKPFEIDSLQGSLLTSSQFGNKPTPIGTESAPVSGFTQFGVKINKPFNPPSIQPSSQITYEQLQSSLSNSNIGVKPTHSAFASVRQPGEATGSYTGQPLKPIVFGSSQSTRFPSKISLGFTGDSSNDGSSLSTVQTPIFGGEVKQSENRFVGNGEVFGGPRVHARFDYRKGYHY